MKRTFSILVLLFLFLLAGCTAAQSEAVSPTPTAAPVTETVANMVGIQKNVSAQWQSNSGRLKICVDAEVVVPDVETYHTIDTVVRPFTYEEALRIFEAFGMSYTGPRVDYETKETAGAWEIREMTLDNGSLLVHAGDSSLIILCSENPASPYKQLTTPTVQRQGTANNCRYTYEEALSIADNAAAIVAPGYVMTGWGRDELYPKDYSDLKNKAYEYNEGYHFCYTPVVDGIPQLHFYQDAEEIDGYSKLPLCNRLHIVVTDEGLFHIYWTGVEAYGERHACRLLPFDQILTVAESLLPLTQAEYEKLYKDTARVWVDRIILSYCRVKKFNQPDQYELIPVWDFMGHRGREVNGKETHYVGVVGNVNESLLTLNAIDGTVIDRSYGY